MMQVPPGVVRDTAQRSSADTVDWWPPRILNPEDLTRDLIKVAFIIAV